MIHVGFQLISIHHTEVKGIGSDGLGDIPVKDGGTLADAMMMIGLGPEKPFMTLVNGNAVAPEARGNTPLSDGDQVVVFPPIEGG